MAMSASSPTPGCFSETMWRIWVVVWLSAVIFSAYYRISGMDEDATLGQKIRICVLWLPPAVSLMYQRALFVNPSFLLGPDLMVAPDPNTTAAEVYEKSPEDTRFIVLSSAGWFCSWAFVSATMLWLAPGCEAALAIAQMITYIWWQVVWYGCCLNRIDQRKTAMDYFKKETGQEIFLACVFGYLGFMVA